jgi:hypothetical protein
MAIGKYAATFTYAGFGGMDSSIYSPEKISTTRFSNTTIIS